MLLGASVHNIRTFGRHCTLFLHNPDACARWIGFLKLHAPNLRPLLLVLLLVLLPVLPRCVAPMCRWSSLLSMRNNSSAARRHVLGRGPACPRRPQAARRSIFRGRQSWLCPFNRRTGFLELHPSAVDV